MARDSRIHRRTRPPRRVNIILISAEISEVYTEGSRLESHSAALGRTALASPARLLGQLNLELPPQNSGATFAVGSPRNTPRHADSLPRRPGDPFNKRRGPSRPERFILNIDSAIERPSSSHKTLRRRISLSVGRRVSSGNRLDRDRSCVLDAQHLFPRASDTHSFIDTRCTEIIAGGSRRAPFPSKTIHPSTPAHRNTRRGFLAAYKWSRGAGGTFFSEKVDAPLYRALFLRTASVQRSSISTYSTRRVTAATGLITRLSITGLIRAAARTRRVCVYTAMFAPLCNRSIAILRWRGYHSFASIFTRDARFHGVPSVVQSCP